MVEEKPTIGRLIFQLRRERGWTQKDLAEKTEMHPNHVSRMEKDKMQPRRSTLEKIAEVFEIGVEDLLALAEKDTRVLGQQLSEEDPELAALMSQVPLLTDEQKDAILAFLLTLSDPEFLMRP